MSVEEDDKEISVEAGVEEESGSGCCCREQGTIDVESEGERSGHEGGDATVAEDDNHEDEIDAQDNSDDGSSGEDESDESAKNLTGEEITELINKSSERDDFLDKLQRTRAEYANYQKRKSKEMSEIRRFAIQGLAVDLTSVLDNFVRAIESTSESKDFEKLLEGIQIVEKQLYKTLEDYGVKPIETVGQPFDPAMHEVLMEEEDDSHPHHTVTMELQRGYLLHDRVIKPSKVKVSRSASREGDEDDTDGESASDSK